MKNDHPPAGSRSSLTCPKLRSTPSMYLPIASRIFLLSGSLPRPSAWVGRGCYCMPRSCGLFGNLIAWYSFVSCDPVDSDLRVAPELQFIFDPALCALATYIFTYAFPSFALSLTLANSYTASADIYITSHMIPPTPMYMPPFAPFHGLPANQMHLSYPALWTSAKTCVRQEYGYENTMSTDRHG